MIILYIGSLFIQKYEDHCKNIWLARITELQLGNWEHKYILLLLLTYFYLVLMTRKKRLSE